MADNSWIEVVPSEGTAWDREGRLEGVYIKRQENIGPNESKMYTIKTKDGEVSVWGSTVLDTKFSEIAMGSQVRIDPLGKVKSEKTGREYMDFAVFWKEGEFQEAGEPSGYEKAKAARKELSTDDANDFLNSLETENAEEAN